MASAKVVECVEWQKGFGIRKCDRVCHVVEGICIKKCDRVCQVAERILHLEMQYVSILCSWKEEQGEKIRDKGGWG